MTTEIPLPEAVLTDVDCTLLNSKRQLSTENLKGIKEYLIEGQKNPNLPRLALCTARHPAALINTVLPVFAKYAPKSLHVVADGAMLINAKAEVIWQEAFEPAVVKKICQDVENLGGSFAFGHGEAFYCGATFIKERQQLTEPIKYLPYSVLVEDRQWTTSLIIINHLNEQVESYMRGLKQSSNFHLNRILSTFNHQFYYNLTLANTSKLQGVKKWSEYHQLDSRKVMMVGDGENDLEIMAESIGVAVANAQPAVKSQAKLVLEKSNDEGAVAWLLQELLNISALT